MKWFSVSIPVQLDTAKWTMTPFTARTTMKTPTKIQGMYHPGWRGAFTRLGEAGRFPVVVLMLMVGGCPSTGRLLSICGV